MASIGDILASLRIDASRFHRDWTQNFTAISAWIEEVPLKSVWLSATGPTAP